MSTDMRSVERPITVLIAALGGEGGGVLTDWIVSAAAARGFPVQSTSIPGVAQRTGATTYYVEIFPVPAEELGGRRPVLALTPGVGDLDLVVASEFLEAGRAIANGFVTRDRTTLIASTSRSYLVVEKTAMGDGRYDDDRLIKAAEGNAKEPIVVDLAAAARESGAILSAVMLGAIAGSRRLPISDEAFEAAIRADGKSVETNLRGFRAGMAAVRERKPARAEDEPKRRSAPAEMLAREIARRVATIPDGARDIVAEGVRRLTAYQDDAYAALYLDRLNGIAQADARCGAGGKLLRETARHLAVRMSYEDVIRVAQAKIDPARFARIEREIGVKPGEPYQIVEFLKPGIEEICQIFPPRLARAIVGFAERRGVLDRFHWGMEIASTSVSGYLRFLLLAKLRRWRRGTWRYAQEREAVENWLALVTDAGTISAELALEVCECARLIKGYGDTWKRGTANFALIEARLIRPSLVGTLPAPLAADAVASARVAALADPEGESLSKCLDDIARRAPPSLAAE